MTRRVAGKVAVVTGAARGMGAAFARCLVAEGAKVMLTDVLDAEGREVAQALGDNARFLHHDVTREAEWWQVIAKTEAAFGPVSVLVNNAGIVAIAPTETLSEADYRRVVDVNQASVFLGMKTALPSLKRAGGGSIINLSSVCGIVGTPQTLAYTASKFAVRGMTKAAAIEFAPFRIRVNSIHPGGIRTPMTTPAPGAEDLSLTVALLQPAARMGEAAEVAAIVLLLASDEAAFATGVEFVVDGGMCCG